MKRRKENLYHKVKRGKITWMPRDVLEHSIELQSTFELTRTNEALRKMMNNSKKYLEVFNGNLR